MTIQEALEIIKFPKEGKVDKKIFKKAIYEKAGLSRNQIEIVKNEINDIRWHYVLKPETINIPIFKNEAYEYEEIQIIGVIIRDGNKKDTVAGIIQKCIPYPVVLILEQDGQIAFSLAAKRINKADISKSVVDEEYITNWIPSIKTSKIKAFMDSLRLKNLSYSNLFEFYRDFLYRAKFFCACEYKDNYL
ncbi:MAG: DUF4391 domain-containing protein, partial [Candidatus Omnitrophica bacterium]|nr:DUF4391 domain-containing protein [Candidatus Omnitrophota bacterium]